MENTKYINFLKKAEDIYSNKVQSKFKLDDKSYHELIKNKSASLKLDDFKIVKDHTLEEFFTKYHKYLGKNIIILDKDELWLMNPKKEYWEIKNDSKSLYFEVPTKALMFMNPYGCIVSALLLAACIGVGGYYLVKSLIPVPPVYEEKYDPDTPKYADHVRVINFDLENLYVEGVGQCEQFVTGKKIEFQLKLGSATNGLRIPTKDEMIFEGIATKNINYSTIDGGCNIWFVAPDDNVKVIASAVDNSSHKLSYSLTDLNASGTASGSNIHAGSKVSIDLSVVNSNTTVVPTTTNTMKIDGIDSTDIVYTAKNNTSSNITFIMPDSDVNLNIRALSNKYSELTFDISKTSNPAVVKLGIEDEDSSTFDIDWGVSGGTFSEGIATSPSINKNVTIKVYGEGVKSISLNDATGTSYSTDNSGITGVIFSPSIDRVVKNAFSVSNIEYYEFLGNLKSIGESSFSNCSSLSCNIQIPSTVTEISACAFLNCANLKGSLECLNRCKGLTFIGNFAFALSVAYEAETETSSYTLLDGDIILPDSLLNVGNSIFAGTSITSIVIST